jgi:hypothetical protein
MATLVRADSIASMTSCTVLDDGNRTFDGQNATANTTNSKTNGSVFLIFVITG